MRRILVLALVLTSVENCPLHYAPDAIRADDEVHFSLAAVGEHQTVTMIADLDFLYFLPHDHTSWDSFPQTLPYVFSTDHQHDFVVGPEWYVC